MTRGLRVVLANVAPLALMWIIVQTGERFSAPRTLLEAGQLTGIIVGAALAWKLRARVALFLLAVFFAEIGSLLLAHLYYRVDRVNGGPVQVAILVASILGVIVGSVINRGRVAATV
jgi:hypothetical protein